MSKLVTYFSYSGVTKRRAESLAKEVSADTFEIKAKIPYTDADVNWQATIAEFLLSDAASFVSGSTFLADGGATASYYYGPLQPEK